MDPRSNSNSGLGLPQPGSDMGQLPSIHAPQSFHPPNTAASHFDAAAPQIGTVAPANPQPMPLGAPATSPQPTVQPQQPAVDAGVPASQPTPNPAATNDSQTSQFTVAPTEDTDTNFDEEWVAKAREVVANTHNDPYLQSQELSKLKAQYIKLRYNKDVKVEQE